MSDLTNRNEQEVEVMEKSELIKSKKQTKLEKRVSELEKRVAELEGQVQEQPRVGLSIDISNLDSYLDKAKQYVRLLEEAKILAQELANVDFEIDII